MAYPISLPEPPPMVILRQVNSESASMSAIAPELSTPQLVDGKFQGLSEDLVAAARASHTSMLLSSLAPATDNAPEAQNSAGLNYQALPTTGYPALILEEMSPPAASSPVFPQPLVAQMFGTEADLLQLTPRQPVSAVAPAPKPASELRQQLTSRREALVESQGILERAAPESAQTDDTSVPSDLDNDTSIPGDLDTDELNQPVLPDPDGLEAVESNDAAPDVPTVLFPEGATPEPFWSNGGLTTAGELLPPTQPTSRPDLPLDLTADYQEFNPLRQTVTARGNVLLRLNNGVLRADKLWANLLNRYVLVEGNVVFQRGQQTIRAERGEYNLLQGQGSLFETRGTLFLPNLGTDLAITSPEDVGPDIPSVVDLLQEGTLGNVRTTGELTFGTGGSATAGATDAGTTGLGVRRIRYEADRVDFDAQGSVARNIRITNDPFSPPELEVTGDAATLTRLNEFEDELVIENGKLVFDQRFRLPLLRSRFLFSRRETDSATPFSVGFDGEERDGLFIERSFRAYDAPLWSLQVTPQLLVQRFINGPDSFANNFGLEIDLTGQLGPTTRLQAGASFSGLNLEEFEDRLRASVRLQQAIGTHSLNLEYSFRDRLFNGSLGFQDVQSSIGAVLLSPQITLGNTGIILNYQASAQFVTADTDLLEFLEPFESESLVDLGRFQGSVSLSRGFLLWQGKPLPPTREEGLRFTPRPVTPNLLLLAGGRGTYSYYTNRDTQTILSAFVGIRGEFGHFSDNFLDSTVFNLTYLRAFVGEGESPFLFDRDVDQNVLSGGLIQQVYGPLRLGVQAAVNLDTGELIDSDFLIEYSRRTYGVLVRFNPIQTSGFIGFRLNDFDWSGRAARFGGADIREVEGGVVR